METNEKSQTRHKWFWLHILDRKKPENDPSNSIRSWIRPNRGEEYDDGDHYIGVLKDYRNGAEKDLHVVLEFLWKVKSTDASEGPKWAPIGKRINGGSFSFENCVLWGEPGRSRTRYKTTNRELIIISMDPADEEVVLMLLKEDA